MSDVLRDVAKVTIGKWRIHKFNFTRPWVAKRRDGWMTRMVGNDMHARLRASSPDLRITLHWNNPDSLESTGCEVEMR